jgi:hypothetical protein
MAAPPIIPMPQAYGMPSQPAAPVIPHAPVLPAPPAVAVHVPARSSPNLALYVILGGLFVVALFLVVFFALKS